MDISASEWGSAFVKICFENYQGAGLFLYLTAAAFLYLLLRKDEKWKSFWGMYGAFLLLIVYNPLIIWRVVDLLGLDDEYYRFIWLIPVTPLIAYAGTSLVMRMNRKTCRLFCLAGVAAAIILCGSTVFSRTHMLTENVYKIPDEVIEICEIIRADCPMEEPRVAADFDLDVLINQYAPDIDLVLSYREIARNQELRGYGTQSDTPSERLHHVILDRLGHDEGYLVYALREGEVDYIVTSRGTPVRDYISQSQCRLIAELDEYCIFRVELEEES